MGTEVSSVVNLMLGLWRSDSPGFHPDPRKGHARKQVILSKNGLATETLALKAVGGKGFQKILFFW